MTERSLQQQLDTLTLLYQKATPVGVVEEGRCLDPENQLSALIAWFHLQHVYVALVLPAKCWMILPRPTQTEEQVHPLQAALEHANSFYQAVHTLPSQTTAWKEASQELVALLTLFEHHGLHVNYLSDVQTIAILPTHMHPTRVEDIYAEARFIT